MIWCKKQTTDEDEADEFIRQSLLGEPHFLREAKTCLLRIRGLIGDLKTLLKVWNCNFREWARSVVKDE